MVKCVKSHCSFSSCNTCWIMTAVRQKGPLLGSFQADLYSSMMQGLPQVSSNFALLAGQYLLQLVSGFCCKIPICCKRRLSWCPRKRKTSTFRSKVLECTQHAREALEKLASALPPSWFQVPALKQRPDCCTPESFQSPQKAMWRIKIWICAICAEKCNVKDFWWILWTPHLIFVTREDAYMMLVLHDQQACSHGLSTRICKAGGSLKARVCYCYSQSKMITRQSHIL